jgi:hypothetical protein
MAFIHSFDSNPNEQVHFHVCVVDGVLEEVAEDYWRSRKRVLAGVRKRPIVADQLAPSTHQSERPVVGDEYGDCNFRFGSTAACFLD